MKKWIKVILEPEELLKLIQSKDADELRIDYDESTGMDALWIEDHSDNLNVVCVP